VARWLCAPFRSRSCWHAAVVQARACSPWRRTRTRSRSSPSTCAAPCRLFSAAGVPLGWSETFCFKELGGSGFRAGAETAQRSAQCGSCRSHVACPTSLHCSTLRRCAVALPQRCIAAASCRCSVPCCVAAGAAQPAPRAAHQRAQLRDRARRRPQVRREAVRQSRGLRPRTSALGRGSPQPASAPWLGPLRTTLRRDFGVHLR
jgi:hypothetical protein